MKCSLDGCAGVYETHPITHTVREGGKVIVIDHVPAEVCSLCGDVLLKPETIRHIEKLLKSRHKPSATVPLYEYA